MSLRFKHESEVPAHLLKRPAATRFDLPGPKRRKYGNEPVVVDGQKFDSKWQANRYGELKQMEAAGLITCLQLEPSFGLHVKGERIGSINPDFMYRRDGVTVIEDTKSPATATKDLWVWKRRHFSIEYGMEITHVVKRRRRAA